MIPTEVNDPVPASSHQPVSGCEPHTGKVHTLGGVAFGYQGQYLVRGTAGNYQQPIFTAAGDGLLALKKAVRGVPGYEQESTSDTAQIYFLHA